MSQMSPEFISSVFPIIGLSVYPGGVIVRRMSLLEFTGKSYEHKRRKITMVSKKSLNRLAILVRSSGIKWTSVMTLTYGLNYPHSGKIAKKHLNAFFTDMKRNFQPFEYFWVCEFQRRGAVHFHVATTLPEPNIFERGMFAQIWSRISCEGDWPYDSIEFDGRKFQRGFLLYTRESSYEVHVHPKAWEKVQNDKGMERYLAKYANKLRQKEVPSWYGDVGRFWGVSRGVKMPAPTNYDASESQVREALHWQGRHLDGMKVLPKIVLVG